jgi:small subunit ribosomal protein S1
VKIDRDEVLLDIGYKSEGVIPSKELSIRHDVDPSEVVKVGDEVEALVLQKEDKEGRLILSKKRAQYERAWGRIEDIMTSGGTILGTVIEVVKGGLILDIGLRGFLPASLVDLRRVRDLHPYVGQQLECKIIELDRNRNNVVLSRRAFLEESQSEGRKKFLESLVKGERRKGTVSSIVNFGAFVDLGGVDGLVHVSELSWKHVDHPSEVVAVGQEVEVEVLDVDLERERVSLSLKATREDPWKEFERKYRAGEVIAGQITKLVPFGAFVRVAQGIEGLVHISELSGMHVESPEQVVQVGEDVRVKVIDVDVPRRRISLSIRQVGDQEPVSEVEIEAEEAPPAAAAEAVTEAPAEPEIPELEDATVAAETTPPAEAEPAEAPGAGPPAEAPPEEAGTPEEPPTEPAAGDEEEEDVTLEAILADLKRREGRE